MRRAAVALALTLFARGVIAADDFFVRTNAELLQTEIGRNAAAAAQSSSVRFTIVEADADRWPAPVTIAIKDGTAGVWHVTLEPRIAPKPHTLRAPLGTYDLTFSAPHYRSTTRAVHLDAAGGELGAITLARLPVLSGTIRSSDGSPIAGAFVTGGADDSAKSDALGAFAMEIAGEWPAWIQVSFPGLSTKELDVPKTKGSFAFPAITMAKGSQLAVELEGTSTAGSIDLAQETGYKRIALRKTEHFGSAAPRVVFKDIDKGDYVLIVRGAEPLERLAVAVQVGEAESVTRKIRVEPLAVEIQLRRGDAAVSDAFITVQSDGNRWSSDLKTGADGVATSRAWERGSYLFAVRMREAGVPLLLFDSIDGKSEAKVRLEIPDRKISGRVTDAETSTPIAKAVVSIESRNDDATGGVLKTSTDENGRFVIDALRDGSHIVRVEAPDHLPAEGATLRVDQSTPHREVTMQLSKGIARDVRVTSRNGVPIPRAFVVEALDEQPIATFRTDALGRGTVRVPPGRSVVLYVIPDEGSFAITRLRSTATPDAQVIIVQDGNAALELHAATSAGKALSRVHFMMRFDGEIIPPQVAEVLEMQRGLAAVTGADGVARIERLPQGFLELWPIRRREEADNLIAGGAASAPVQVALKEGLNVARMTFEARH